MNRDLDLDMDVDKCPNCGGAGSMTIPFNFRYNYNRIYQMLEAENFFLKVHDPVNAYCKVCGGTGKNPEYKPLQVNSN